MAADDAAGNGASNLFTPAHGRDNGYPPDVARVSTIDPGQGLLYELKTARELLRTTLRGGEAVDYPVLTGQLVSLLDNAAMFAAWMLEPSVRQPGQEQYTPGL